MLTNECSLPNQISAVDVSTLAPEVMSACRSVAWDCYKARDLVRAEIIARGLVSCDDRDWYHHALLAATLRKQRRFREALAQIDAGLALLPGNADLVVLRSETFAALQRLADVERKLALGLPLNPADDDAGESLPPTPAERRRHILEMLRLVSSALAADHQTLRPPVVGIWA
jgi:hypothetical protein